jgi:hypothetical protein
MAQAKILTGARAKVSINGVTVGLFANCSWSVRQDKSPAYILGRFNPAEITPTSQEPVSLSLTGYRVVDSGPYKVANATLLRDLISEEDFEVTITDRQTNKTIFLAVGCRVTGWSSGVAARGVSDIRVDVIGIRAEDEFGIAANGDEDVGGSNLEDGA